MLMGREDSRADLAPLHLALPIEVESMCSAYGCRVVAFALVVYLADATEKHLENVASAGFGIDDVAKICQHWEQCQAVVVTHGMFLCANSVSRCCKNAVAA